MTTQISPPAITHKVDLGRFELNLGGSIAFTHYSHELDRVIFDHTFVPDVLRGKGVAATLVRAALEEARLRKWKVVPRCTFVAGFIEHTPEFADLVAR